MTGKGSVGPVEEQWTQLINWPSTDPQLSHVKTDPPSSVQTDEHSDESSASTALDREGRWRVFADSSDQIVRSTTPPKGMLPALHDPRATITTTAACTPSPAHPRCPLPHTHPLLVLLPHNSAPANGPARSVAQGCSAVHSPSSPPPPRHGTPASPVNPRDLSTTA